MADDTLSDFQRHVFAALKAGRRYAALLEHDLRVGAQHVRDGTWRIPQVWTPGTRSGRSFTSDDAEGLGRFESEGLLNGPFEHWHEQVDIYLSAGPNEGDGSLDAPSCHTDNDANCSIYRVQWDLGRGEAVEVEEVVPKSIQSSYIKPSVNPSNTAIAYQQRYHTQLPTTSHFNDISSLDIKDMRANRYHSVSDTSEDEGRPHFSHWPTDQTIWFQKIPDENNLYKVSVSYSSAATISNTREVHAPVPDTSLQYDDPNVHYDPVASFYFGSEPPYIASQGELIPPYGDGRSSSKVHHKNAYDSGRIWVLDFKINNEHNGGCHHPAWNISGDRILCGLQQNYSQPGQNYGHMVTIDGAAQRMLYKFAYNHVTHNPIENKWTNTIFPDNGLLFTPMTPEALESTFRRGVGRGSSIFPQRNRLATDKSEYLYTYKFAEWCADDDFIVTTLYITDNSGTITKYAASRVMLVKISTGKYWDITAAIENTLNAGFNSVEIFGVFSTCSLLMEKSLISHEHMRDSEHKNHDGWLSSQSSSSYSQFGLKVNNENENPNS